jgi:hypothetical protein
MRTSLVYGCLGLISITSLAGCGLFSKCRDDCACSSRPVARMVVRNGVVVALAPTGPVTISGSSRVIAPAGEEIVVIEAPKPLPQPDKLPPIPTLPVANVEEPAPFKMETLTPGPENTVAKNTLPAVDVIIDPAFPPRAENGDNDPRAKEKTVAPKSMHIQYGHSEEFKTVTGQVQMWRRTVRLRYAPIDQEDVYGGFVVLEGGAELTKMRDGQHVRVRGVLIAPEDRNGAAHYRVQAIEVLD